jgi:hypothetical protein
MDRKAHIKPSTSTGNNMASRENVKTRPLIAQTKERYISHTPCTKHSSLSYAENPISTGHAMTIQRK